MPQETTTRTGRRRRRQPVERRQLYPGVTIMRDQSFGPNAKDVVDIFYADKGGENRTILIYVPGGGGNKIEQQAAEANAFYDNIGRWATKNGMVGVTVQRHPGMNWDDGGRAIAMAVDWVKANATKFHGNPNRIFIWAHSAGNGPPVQYVGPPGPVAERRQVKGAVFMSGNPVNFGRLAARAVAVLRRRTPGGRGAAPAERRRVRRVRFGTSTCTNFGGNGDRPAPFAVRAAC